MIARILDCIAHHRCGAPKAIIVDALRGNVRDKLPKPALRKVFLVPAATGLA